LVIAVTYLIIWVWLRSRDSTHLLPPIQVPIDPDPCEIAYLRGGENEVLRLIILELIQRKYLKVEGDSFGRNPGSPDVRHLEEPFRSCYSELAKGMKASEVFQSRLPATVKRHCQEIDSALMQNSLLHNPQLLRLRWQAAFPAALLIAGLGTYKLMVALAKGRSNVGFLLMLGIGGIIGLAAVSTHALPRCSRRGREYLQKLRTAFDQLRPRGKTYSTASALDPNLLLLASVFGISILADSAYASYHKAFKRASADSSGGCGSGCGSSCGGGCGGGGCGGCGG
jgi:uncharacterized protein (TIGR04222 family)